jgi:hypothetical protein
MRNVQPGNNLFQSLLNSLRETRGFTQAEMQELGDNRIIELLNCLSLSAPAGVKPLELLIEYQSKNCQAGPSRTVVAIDVKVLPANEIVKVLETRGVVASAADSKDNLEKALASSAGGNKLTEPELMVLTRDSLTNILNNRNIANTASENKTQLVKKIFNR